MAYILDVVGLIGGVLIVVAALVEIMKSTIRRKDVVLLRSFLLLVIGSLIVVEEVVKLLGFSVARTFHALIPIAMFVLAVAFVATYLRPGVKRTEVEEQLVTS